MSRILWKSLLLPDLQVPGVALVDESYKDSVENTRAYAKASSEIEIPDPKAFRSMSRASLFTAHICQGGAAALKPFLEKSSFSVGIYCAVENGPIDAASTAKILAQNDESRFPEYYRKFRGPKMYLKQLPNLVPAQMGIFMGIQGPMNVYTHSLTASLHALDQAEWDLQGGVVDAALVCTAHAFDDFVVVKRSRDVDAKARCLTEGAAAMLLVKDGPVTDWAPRALQDSQNFFGISDPIINIFRN